MRTTITTYSGKTFDYDNPQPDQICIEDIAHHLGNVCRFAGATKEFYSVAQHSILVAGLAAKDAPLPEVQTKYALLGLLHDASEAYLGDVPTPWKHMVGFDYYRACEERTMKAIGECLNIDLTSLPEEVHKADKEAFYIEQAVLMSPPYHAENPHIDKQIRFPILTPRAASQAWFQAYKQIEDATASKIIIASS